MVDRPVCSVSGESPEEERINFLTHLFGLIFSLVAFPFLLTFTYFNGDTWLFVSCVVYGTTLILLYGASTYYHRCQLTSRKRIFKIIDHACIYLLIAGTYTPFALGPLRAAGGFKILCIEWSIAIVGIVLKIFFINRLEIVSVLAYLGMGWLVLFSMTTLMQELTLAALLLLFIGGLFYSAGTIFFLWDALPFNHAIWHLFVLSGSICHYGSIFTFVQNGVWQ